MFNFFKIILLLLVCRNGSFEISSYHNNIVRDSFLMSSKFEKLPGSYLQRMVDRKKIEVDNLLRRHQESDDPLVMRMSYMASVNKYNVTYALKRPAGSNNEHTISLLVDLKRKSPTIPNQRNIVDFSSISKFSELLSIAGVDGFLINTDELEYGGRLSDIKDVSKTMKSIKSNKPPVCICKDIIIHPIQIAQALQQGAGGILIIMAVVGSDLEVLLDACTIMGTEAVVEVHTPNELEFALSKGATIFLVNMWDRMTGKYYPDQAKGLISMMPLNAVAIAAGNINNIEQVKELGYYGFDSVVLGRGLAEIPDIKKFIDDVHLFKGPPRSHTANFGMKGLPYGF